MLPFLKDAVECKVRFSRAVPWLPGIGPSQIPRTG